MGMGEDFATPIFYISEQWSTRSVLLSSWIGIDYGRDGRMGRGMRMGNELRLYIGHMQGLFPFRPNVEFVSPQWSVAGLGSAGLVSRFCASRFGWSRAAS
jgi:hypothetical protein